MRSIRIAVISFLLVVIISFPCLGANNTYSVEIQNVDKKEVIDYIISDMISQGYSIIAVDDYQASFRKNVDNVFAAALLGSKFNSTPELRVIYSIVQIGAKVKVAAEVKVVTNPGSAFEKYTPVRNSTWQDYLDGFNGSVEEEGEFVLTKTFMPGPFCKPEVKEAESTALESEDALSLRNIPVQEEVKTTTSESEDANAAESVVLQPQDGIE